jgi:hypothetical protein
MCSIVPSNALVSHCIKTGEHMSISPSRASVDIMYDTSMFKFLCSGSGLCAHHISHIYVQVAVFRFRPGS